MSNAGSYEFDSRKFRTEDDQLIKQDSDTPKAEMKDWIEEVWKSSVLNAQQNKLKWNLQLVKEMNFILSKSAKLADAPDRQISKIEALTSRLSLFEFQVLISVPIHVRNTTDFYRQLMVMYSNMIKTFYIIFWKRNLRSKPYFKSDIAEFQDPFFRQLVRKKNLGDQELIQNFFAIEFNIKEFIVLCLKKFIIHESSLWANHTHSMHLFSLKLFLDSFEYGFWTYREIDDLNEIVHTLVLSMTVYEQFLATMKPEDDSVLDLMKAKEGGEEEDEEESFELDENGEKKKKPTPMEIYFQMLFEIKKIIGEIYLHMVLIILDNHVESTLMSYDVPVLFESGPLRNDIEKLQDMSKLFTYSEIKYKLFYTYFGYSISTYFLKPTTVFFRTANWMMLDVIHKKLIGFLTDVSLDFYFHSIRTLKPDALMFYRSTLDNPISKKASVYQNLLEMVLKLVNDEMISDTDIYETENHINFDELKYKEIDYMFKSVKKGTHDHHSMFTYPEFVFKEIQNYLNENYSQPDVFVGIQTAFSIDNICPYILSIMVTLIDHNSKSTDPEIHMKVIKTCRLGAHTIAEISHNNTLSISKIFEGNNIQTFKSYSETDPLGAVVLLSKIFLNDSGVFICEMHSELYSQALLNFKHSLDKKVCIRRKEDNDIDYKNVDIMEVLCCMLYGRLFHNIFKYKKTHGVKLEITFMKTVSSNVITFLKYFLNRRVAEANDSFFQEIKEDQIYEIKSWESLTTAKQRYLLEEMMFQVITAFHHSVKKFHYEGILGKFNKFFTENKIRQFFPLLESKRGETIFKVIIKMFSTFRIFNQNTTFYYRKFLEEVPEKDKEIVLKKDEFKFEIIGDLSEIFEKMNRKIVSGFNDQDLKLFFECYYPVCFKFVCGFMMMTKSKEIEKTDTANLENISLFVKRQMEVIEDNILIKCKDREMHPLENGLEEFDRDLDADDHGVFSYNTSRKKIDKLKKECRNLLKSILKLMRYFHVKHKEIEEIAYALMKKNHGDLKEYISERLKFHGKYRIQNDLTNKDPIDFQTAAKNFTDKEMFRDLSQFRRKPSTEKDFLWISVFSYKQLFKTDNDMGMVLPQNASRLTISDSKCQHVVYYMQERYKDYKGYMMDNFKKNKMLYVINIQDSHTKNMKNIVSFFFSEFSNMDLSFKKISNNFLAENFYMYILFFLDNMMQNTSKFREEIFNFIHKASNESSSKKKSDMVLKSMQNIWHLNEILFHHLIFKNFIDHAWTFFYKPYYLVSNFIQNLCEDNFVDFKDWFTSYGGYDPNAKSAHSNQQMELKKVKSNFSKADSKKMSYLEQMHFRIEQALLTNDVFSSSETYLTAQDREEMFPIFARAIECLTEFINGGICSGAEKLYNKRMDIFVGIVFRIIDDLDSSFYELKNNVIVYISALIETPNPDVTEFVAQNFSVTRIFNLIKTLIKRLYLKQMFMNNPSLAEEAGWSPENPGITARMEENYKIESWRDLLQLYKLYDESFSEHQMIDISILLFVFMNNVGKTVSRYGHFVEEIKISTQKINKLPEETNIILNQRESAVVWKFLMHITVELEIEKEANPSLLEASKEKANHSIKNGKILEIYIFQKKSVSFFLNSKMKLHFFKTVKIESLEEKRSGFIKIFDEYDEDCQELCHSYRENRYFYELNEFQTIRSCKLALFILTCIINLLVIIFYSNITADYRNARLGDGARIIGGFTIAAFAGACLFLIFWIYNNYSKIVRKGFRTLDIDQKKDSLTVLQWFKIYVYWTTISKINFLHFSWLIVCYALGWFLSPIFYGLALFMIADLSENIQSILKAFSKNWEKLLLGLVLIVICINVFAFLMFDQYPFYYQNFSPFVNFMCDTYFKCFLNAFNLGLINDEGIAAVMDHVANTSDSHFIGRFFFDVLYFLIITIILLEIIFGIIADSYDEYQGDERKREYDSENICFACGFKREEIEKFNFKFDAHIKFHRVWKYFFYYQYLKRCPVNDYNGTDIYVSELIEKQQLSWLPTKRTKELEDLEALKSIN